MVNQYGQDEKAKKAEIEYLEKTIKKLRFQADMHYIFLGIGILVALIGIIYIILNPEVILGSIYVICIGLGIVFYNIILRKRKILRANQLNIDLEREKNNND